METIYLKILYVVLITIVPIMLSGIIGILYKLYKAVVAIKLGTQAVLRDDLLGKYQHYVLEKNWAPDYEKRNFENLYNQYESLGQNGVMEEKYKEMMRLSELPPREGLHVP